MKAVLNFIEKRKAQVSSTLFAKDPQPIYKLPHDHRLHKGETYHHNDYMEWQYFTAIGTDKETGDEISVFICPFQQGWEEGHKDRGNPMNFAFTNLTTKEFHSANTLWEGDYTGTAGDPDSEDFAFEYRISQGENQFMFSYDHKSETWRYAGHCDIYDEVNTPYAFDVSFTVKEPGYVPGAYHGIENIGWDADGAGYRHNPQTTAGLTRYITIPRGDLTGTVTVAGREYDIEADVWYEHQWGNYRNVLFARYFWGYMRLEDGTAFTWRQYYKSAGWKEFDRGMTRFQVTHPDNRVEYAFGPSFVYTPTEFWTSPTSGNRYPWYGTMETPLGIFYFSPAFPEQESESNIPGLSFIEGIGVIRSGSQDGPIVGRGFVEMVDLTNEGMLNMDLPEKEIFMDFSKVNR